MDYNSSSSYSSPLSDDSITSEFGARPPDGVSRRTHACRTLLHFVAILAMLLAFFAGIPLVTIGVGPPRNVVMMGVGIGLMAPGPVAVLIWVMLCLHNCTVNR